MSDKIKSHSCGILLHRIDPKTGDTLVFLGEANNPRYWNANRKHPEHIWGLPKGRMEPDESPLETAKREFEEEIGLPAPNLHYEKTMDFKTPHHKLITVFEADATGIEMHFGEPEVITREYPKGSGEFVSYTEFKDAQWIPLDKALTMVMWGQKGILVHLETELKKKKN